MGEATQCETLRILEGFQSTMESFAAVVLDLRAEVRENTKLTKLLLERLETHERNETQRSNAPGGTETIQGHARSSD